MLFVIFLLSMAMEGDMADQTGMRQLTSGLPTTSAKIRALDTAGYKRADIARFLGIRYQHVRNVLVQGPPKRDLEGHSASKPAPSDGVASPSESQPTKIKIGPAGRIVIPAPIRAVMDVEEGDTLLAGLDADGSLQLTSARTAMRRAQRLTRELIPGQDSLSDSLLEDRRREALKDKDDG